MKALFADTGYWIALLIPSDALHEDSVRLSKSLGGFRTVTSELVMVELLNSLARHGAAMRRKAVLLVEKLHNSPSVEVIAVSSELIRKSVRLYRQRPDKKWSLTDCSSFVLMSELRLQEALAHDLHFQQAGFRALLRVDS